MRTLLIFSSCALLLGCERPGTSTPEFAPLPSPDAWMHEVFGTDLEKVTGDTPSFSYVVTEACPLEYDWRALYEVREPGVSRTMRLKGAFAITAKASEMQATFSGMELSRQWMGKEKAPVVSTPQVPESAKLTRVADRRGLIEVGAPSTGWRAYGSFRGVGPMFPTLPKEQTGVWTLSMPDPTQAIQVEVKAKAESGVKAKDQALEFKVSRGDWFETGKGRVLITRAHTSGAERWTVFTAFHEAGYVVASRLVIDEKSAKHRTQRLDARVRLRKGCDATRLLVPLGSERR